MPSEFRSPRARNHVMRQLISSAKARAGVVNRAFVPCLAGVCLSALLLFSFASQALHSDGSGNDRGIGQLRGEPINGAASNAPVTPIASVGIPSEAPTLTTSPVKIKHPKPASYQHRMVEFQVSQAEGSNLDATFGGTRAKVIFSASQLAALPGPPLPAGCEDLDFARLSSFPFEVTRKMADGSQDMAAAMEATRSKIPKAVQDLDYRFVAIRGFLLPLRMNNGLTIEFLLLRNQNMCCFGSVPKANEWICVQAAGEGVKPIMDQPVTIMGKLRVGEIRENGYLVGIYRMDGAQVYISEENQR